jgi:hypothetical protein
VKRYEQVIRVTSTFFAALLGFGLKTLLDASHISHELAAPCFVLSVLLFLRFLIGSANHCWFDYIITDSYEHDDAVKNITKSKPAHPDFVMMDLGALILFGVVGAFSCYATNLKQFFTGHLILVGLSFGWSILYIFRDDKKRGWPWVRVVALWAFLNSAQFAAVVTVWHEVEILPTATLPIPGGDLFPWPVWDANLAVLALIYLMLLALDVYVGLSNLHNAKSS